MQLVYVNEFSVLERTIYNNAAMFAGYVRHVHRPGNSVRIMHFAEIEYPSGKHYPDYAIPREYSQLRRLIMQHQ